MTLRSLPARSAVLAFAALVAVLGVPAVARAAGEPVTIEQAETDLNLLKTQLGSHKTANEDLIGSLDAVLNAYKNVKPLDPPAADASEDVKKAFEVEKKKWEDRVAAFRKNAEKEFLDALTVNRVKPKATNNEREDVNLKAAQALGATGNRALSPKIIAEIQKGLMTAKYQVTAGLWDAAFGALGTLGDPDTLVWYQGDFVHTKNSPPEVVDQLVAAHKSIPLFKLKDVGPKLRHDLAKAMITPYTSTESAAEQSKNDPKKQASKVFWDRIRTDAIKAVQYLSGEPTDATGGVIATMKDFQSWLRDHDDIRKAPWKEEKGEKTEKSEKPAEPKKEEKPKNG